MERKRKSAPKEDQVIPENLWLDDVGKIKRKENEKDIYHAEIQRKLTCNCISSCRPQGHQLIAESFKERYGKQIPANLHQLVITLYEADNVKFRQETWGSKPLDSKQFYEWGIKNNDVK